MRIIDHCPACRSRQTEHTDQSIDDQSMNNWTSIGSYSFHFRDLLIIFITTSILLIPDTEACFPGGRLIRRIPKNEAPLVFKQHIPNVPENSMAASGPREGRIRRFNKRFKELVVNYNPDIIFKDEEGNGEDRIMSVRCKEKLDALAMLVMNFWPGIKLRVTEAWDQEGHHSAESLHYEGRAVDITTSDRDRNKYGLLAKLAAQAGFDWVYYENRMHVHASVKSDAVTKHKKVFRCFPGHSTVLTPSGHRKSMSDLRIGDRVAVSSKIDNSIIFEPIVAFLHRNTIDEAQFVEIDTDQSGYRFVASSDHLIYVWNHTALSPKAMGRIDIGDTVIAIDRAMAGNWKFEKSALDTATAIDHSGNATSVKFEKAGNSEFEKARNSKFEKAGNLKLLKVQSIRSVLGQGVYAPLTPSGTIFVDDILASCYAAVSDNRLAHTVMAPLRLWYRLVGGGKLESWTDADGVHWYARLLWNVAEYLERWGFVIMDTT